MAEAHENGIEVEGLVREFKKGPTGGRRHRPDRRPRRDLRLPRAQRRRQVDHRPHADHAPPAHRRHRPRRRPRRRSRGPAVRDAIGVALQEAALDPFLTAREHMRLQAGMHGLPQREAERRGDSLIDRVGPVRCGRPQGRRLLRRDEAPARPGARARPRAAHPVPRRADHRPRRPEPHRALGRGDPPRPASTA